MNEKLKVNVEDIEIYDIETEEDVTPELSKEDELTNAEFLDKLGEHCAEIITPCNCNAHEFMARQAAKARLLQGTNAEFAVMPDQELVDGFKFSAILVMKAEKYTSVSAIIKECKNCHRLEYFGDSSVLAQLMAEATVNRMNTDDEEIEQADADELTSMLGDNITFEDLPDEVEGEPVEVDVPLCDCEHCEGNCQE